ncbi:hypothetical protein [Geobacillus sp. BK01]|uniref:hypothetical protein n=1 Tax=Geobacillus sp. BK01 TaxID=3457328 RepID=UPI003FA5B437
MRIFFVIRSCRLPVKHGHFPPTSIGSRHKKSGFNTLLNLRKARFGQASHEINSLPGGGAAIKNALSFSSVLDFTAGLHVISLDLVP